MQPLHLLNAATGFYLVYLLVMAVLIALYNSYLLQDNRTPDTDPEDRRIKWKWHATGAAIHLANAALGWYVQGWQLALFVFAVFWVVFAGIVHRTGLNKPFFYVGQTAFDDRAQRWLYAKTPLRVFRSLEGMSAVLKITTFVFSLTMVVIKFVYMR